jgi:predicted nucleic acid-binding protein
LIFEGVCGRLQGSGDAQGQEARSVNWMFDAPEAKGIQVWRVLLSFQFVDFDELAAVHAGRIRAYLEPRGIRIGPMGTLLAAHRGGELASLNG